MQQPPGQHYNPQPPTSNFSGYPPNQGSYRQPGPALQNGSSSMNYPPKISQGGPPQASMNGYDNRVPNGPNSLQPQMLAMSYPSKMPPGIHEQHMMNNRMPPQSMASLPTSQTPYSSPNSYSQMPPPQGSLAHPISQQPPISRAGGDPSHMTNYQPGPSMPPIRQMHNMQIGTSQPEIMPMSNSMGGPTPGILPGSAPLGQPPMQGQNPPYSGGPPSMMIQPPHGSRQQVMGQHSLGHQQSDMRQPPLMGQSPISGQPPMPAQPPMTGQPTMTGLPQMQGQPPMVGQPPMPGQPPIQGGYPGQQPGMMGGPAPQQASQYPGQQPQQQRRLDPDAMPSPIQVIEADLSRSEEPFRTDVRGSVPPLVTTKFVVEDCGSASPRYIRCTTYNLPATADMAKSCQVPMAMSIKPLSNLPEGEAPPLLVEPLSEGPLRCKRCKAYMCPQFKFTDGGRRFQCVMCSAISDTPHYYFDHIDHMGQRVDKYRRPELCRGSYELIATKDYCRNDEFPNPPAFIFAIDVSYNAIKCGMVELLCKEIKSLLDHLPCDVGAQQTAIRVAFFTYNNTLHFYNLKSTLAQPQMLVVSDVSDVFVPLQDGFLVNVEESRHVINSLLEQIPEMFADTRETEVVFAPVVQAAVQALKAANCAGKLFMFNTTMPTGEAPGKLRNRDDRKVIGTDKEKVLFSTAGNFYPSLAKDCVVQGCCVDLFLFPNQFMDVATLGQIAQLTGGNIYKYNFFRPEVDGSRFIADLDHDISRNMVFDAIMRVRSSTGIRAVNFAGALYMSNTTDVELAGMDCDQAICVELKHDDKITEEYGAYIQVALLFTSVGGQRRLRVHNLSMAVCTQLGDLYRSCETDVLVNYMAKAAILAGLSQAGSKIREEMVSRAATILATYRKHCASPSSPGQLILPECMKLLPVYLNCLLKNDSIHSSHEISTDDRAYLRQLVLSLDVAQTQVFFYPRLMPVRGYSPPNLPKAVRCSEDRLNDSEAYLLDNGLNLFLWVGNAIDPEWIRSVFGVQSAAQIDIDQGNLHPFDNPDSQQLRDLIAAIQSKRTRNMKLTIIRQRDKLEPWFKHFLVEDRGMGGGASYVDFLCHVHKEIRAILA